MSICFGSFLDNTLADRRYTSRPLTKNDIERSIKAAALLHERVVAVDISLLFNNRFHQMLARDPTLQGLIEAGVLVPTIRRKGMSFGDVEEEASRVGAGLRPPDSAARATLLDTIFPEKFRVTTDLQRNQKRLTREYAAFFNNRTRCKSAGISNELRVLIARSLERTQDTGSGYLTRTNVTDAARGYQDRFRAREIYSVRRAASVLWTKVLADDLQLDVQWPGTLQRSATQVLYPRNDGILAYEPPVPVSNRVEQLVTHWGGHLDRLCYEDVLEIRGHPDFSNYHADAFASAHHLEEYLHEFLAPVIGERTRDPQMYKRDSTLSRRFRWLTFTQQGATVVVLLGIGGGGALTFGGESIAEAGSSGIAATMLWAIGAGSFVVTTGAKLMGRQTKDEIKTLRAKGRDIVLPR